MNETILDADEIQKPTHRRRQLLPIWIKIFIWIFLVFGAIIPVAIVMSALGESFDLSLYGLETRQPFTPVGLLIMFLFAFKAAVAFGLWWEKDWAVDLALGDAVLGILVCFGMMILTQFNTIRLELIALVPYLIALQRIRPAWRRQG